MTEPTLIEKQFIFARLLADLIKEAYRRGYQITMGECWRPPEMAAIYAKQGKGIKNSLHTLRLAVDLNLFFNGKLLKNIEDYEGLGLFWKKLGTPVVETAWGGFFKSLPDPYHFSIAHNGVR